MEKMKESQGGKVEEVFRTPGRKLEFTESKPFRLIQKNGLAESTEPEHRTPAV